MTQLITPAFESAFKFAGNVITASMMAISEQNVLYSTLTTLGNVVDEKTKNQLFQTVGKVLQSINTALVALATSFVLVFETSLSGFVA